MMIIITIDRKLQPWIVEDSPLENPRWRGLGLQLERQGANSGPGAGTFVHVGAGPAWGADVCPWDSGLAHSGSGFRIRLFSTHLKSNSHLGVYYFHTFHFLFFKIVIFISVSSFNLSEGYNWGHFLFKHRMCL